MILLLLLEGTDTKSCSIIIISPSTIRRVVIIIAIVLEKRIHGAEDACRSAY